jgi:gluconolactonase
MSSLFAQPEIIQAELFAELPGKFRKVGQPTEWAAARRGGKPIDSFLEGPSFNRTGNLYVTDIPFGRVFCVLPSGTIELVTEYDGEPNGLKIHKEGRAFITNVGAGAIQRARLPVAGGPMYSHQ